ncbi:hypothetical protein GM658_14260 [Pseudoduganella eburnea]|uniref:Uncharacterized protein n=1 Tax=Massilia eburnea TaxID=1776165 RepID=A0A6L6QJE4_9BURK|nr:hypothetical protein [Massilia eburnea]MTW11766.1 hypothetical protein [Massilia eburnea]
MELHIIYTETDMLLSKVHFNSWREVQDQYPDYQASLGPWAPEAVIDYLAFDYPNLAPSAATQVAAVLAGESPIHVLTFK